jgi:hypothetical protein
MPVAPQPSTINAGGGGDYTSITAWKADIPATLTQEQDALVVGAVTEATGVPFTGFTTTSSNKITIQGKSGSRHTGVSGTGARITGGSGVLRVQVDFFELDWIEIAATDGNYAVSLQRSGGTNSLKIQHSILKSSASVSNFVLAALGSTSNYIIRNSILYATGANRVYDARGAGTLESDNCIFYTQGGDFPFLNDAGHVVKNTYVGGASNQCFWSGGTTTGSNNAGSDTTATAQFSSSINSIAGSTAYTSVTATSENFTTKTGFTTFTDVGVTIAAVTDDIIGTSRPQGSAYDIGAFENISAGGSTPWQSFVQDNQPLPDTRRAVAI